MYINAYYNTCANVVRQMICLRDFHMRNFKCASRGRKLYSPVICVHLCDRPGDGLNLHARKHRHTQNKHTHGTAHSLNISVPPQQHTVAHATITYEYYSMLSARPPCHTRNDGGGVVRRWCGIDIAYGACICNAIWPDWALNDRWKD